jgi:flavodoxin
MKVLIAYYSRTGKNKKIAQEIAKRLKADIDEINSLENYSGSIGWIKAGKDSFKRKEIKIKNSYDPCKYDLVIIGCPIWAGVMAAPLYSYVKKNKFKKIAFFSVSGAGKSQRIHEQFKEMGINAKTTLMIKESDLKNVDQSEKIDEFCKSLK